MWPSLFVMAGPRTDTKAVAKTLNPTTSSDTAASRARLYMASALRVLLTETLALIGVSAPEKM